MVKTITVVTLHNEFINKIVTVKFTNLLVHQAIQCYSDVT